MSADFRKHQVSALARGHREPLLPDAAASISRHSADRHGAVLAFHPGGGDAHPVILSVEPRRDGAGRSGSLPRPQYEHGQPAAWREQDGEEPADRDARQSGAPGNDTKRARIGKASGFAHRSFRLDAVHHMYATTAMHRPAVTHADTHRDKKKTGRLTAFPQPAGRFPRVWQVLGSNQRRLSRRFYRPPVFRPSAGFSRCAYATGPRLSYRQSGLDHRSRRFS